MSEQKTKYWKNISIATSTLYKGIKQTSKHFIQSFSQRENVGIDQSTYFDQKTGLQTSLYPHETLLVPDVGRYKLHNEIDDCIVCDKCAKVCPVDCIDIEPIRAVEDMGKTSDGTPKRIYAAKFDIDMAKCCFCGLCTTVCPTECLTMSNEFDYSEFDVQKHNFEFGIMTPLEIAEKRQKLEEHNKQKAEQEGASEVKPKPASGNVVFKPKMKPAIKKPDTGEGEAKPKFRPKIKMKPKMDVGDEKQTENTKVKKVKPRMKPVIKKTEEEKDEKPKFRPKPRPVIKKKKEDEE